MEKSDDTPPPPPPPPNVAGWPQAVSRFAPVAEVVSVVPPTPVTQGSDAGKSTAGPVLPVNGSQSDDPLSPDAANTETPAAAASSNSASAAAAAEGLMAASQAPQLIEISLTWVVAR